MRLFLTLFALVFAMSLAARADDARLDSLFDALADADERGWQQIENSIWEEWSETGSASLDLLLQRGREAMSAGDTAEAIEHFTALVEMAPDFPEGYNARATAYFEAGLFGPSMSDIVRVLSLEPRHFGALAGLGVILEETGFSQRALEAFRAAHAIHPHRADLREAVERLEAELQGTDI